MFTAIYIRGDIRRIVAGTAVNGEMLEQYGGGVRVLPVERPYACKLCGRQVKIE
jgi:hypothetical protein